MIQLSRIVLLGLLAVLLMAPEAQAQWRQLDYQFFVDIDGGYQSGSSDHANQTTFSLYGEDGSVDSNYDIDRSGGLFNFSAGLLVWNNIGFAVGYSRATSAPSVEVNVTSPHPLFYNQPRSNIESFDLSRSTSMAHFMAVYKLPLFSKMELTLTGGPTRLSVKQPVVMSVERIEGGWPYDTLADVALTTEPISKIGVGFNIGADLTYMLYRNYGAGVFVRYAGGQIDFPVMGDLGGFDVGGLQVGGGLRWRW